MSYPPRPPMGMMPQGQQSMFGVMNHSPMQQQRPRHPYVPRPRGPGPGGRDPNSPPVTVFVGNISERSQDTMIRLILTTCGPLISWRRVQGATGKLQAFGFCEYGGPEFALRAIRILHDFEIGDKKLVVKVDSKTKDMLDQYNKNLFKKAKGKSPTPEESQKDFVSEDTEKEDKLTKDRIIAILRDHEKEMKSNDPFDSRRLRSDLTEQRQTGPRQSLAEVDLEDNKREIIHREIDKFREIMKLREAEKEEEKKQKEKEREKDKGDEPTKPRRESPDREPAVISEQDLERRREREKSQRKRFSRSPRSKSRGRSGSPAMVKRSSRSRSHRDRTRSRSRSRSRERRDREREHVSQLRKSTKDIWKDEEMEEELRDRKKAERKAREKEAAYQERLRRWEDRESRKTKDIEREKEREIKNKEEMDREARKIREFLEDYSDERDDSKFYKGIKLEQRLADRNRELQKDVEDRLKEKEELEELKAQLAAEGFEDPAAELQRRIAFHETFQNPQPIHRDYEDSGSIPLPSTNGDFQPPVAPFQRHHHEHLSPMVSDIQVPEETIFTRPRLPSVDPDDHQDAADSPDYSHDNSRDFSRNESREREDDDPPSRLEEVPLPLPVHHHKSPITIAPINLAKPSFQMASRRKIDMKDVFNQEEDESSAPKKRRLPLPSSSSSHETSSSSTTTSGKKGRGGDAANDDKRRHIKNLIDKIPTDKNALFEFNVEWNMVDASLMEKRIRPWVNKKIAEYIGEPEPTLSDFICSKVLTGSPPKSILDDVQVVLDDEAEVFVVKLWRLLIYEIENKKLKMASKA